MCTCITYQTDRFYFGRNLDLECSFGEQVVLTPRNHPIPLREQPALRRHYAMLGMATVMEDYPLYAEGFNEKGLCVAGLYFPGNGVYHPPREGWINLAPFELIPWLLGKFQSVQEAEPYLQQINLLDMPFGPGVPVVSMHWMMADKDRCLVLEPMKQGLCVYENPINVLTNNPPFPFHRQNLNNYLSLTAHTPENRLSPQLDLEPYGQGMGALGMPGDPSPASRFVRAAFFRFNSVCEPGEEAGVTQFFHLLDGVSMVRGTAASLEGKLDHTIYSCCASVQQGLYYYKTYGNSRIQGISLYRENLEGENLTCFPIAREQQIQFAN